MHPSTEQHTVQKGESVTKIVTDAMKAQGFENPTHEQIKNARAEFLEANKDTVKTYNGPKAEWKGNKYFHPNDKVNRNLVSKQNQYSKIQMLRQKKHLKPAHSLK